MPDVKLNLGCDIYPHEGYVNIDNNPLAKADLFHDVRDGLPFKDDSCVEVWASHFLEHLYPHEMLDLTAEVWRVLKVGGIFRILVPLGETGDLDHVHVYTETTLKHLEQDDSARYFQRTWRWKIAHTRQRKDTYVKWRPIMTLETHLEKIPL